MSCRLSDLFDTPIRNGLFRPTGVRGKGVKMINMGEIFAQGIIGDIEMELVPLSESEEERYLLKKGDLLFARASLADGAGKCCIFTGNEKTTFESHVIRIRINTNLADPRYYYYFLNSHVGKQLIETIVERTTASGIRSSDLANLLIPYPERKLQEKIANFGEILDRKIELNKQMNKYLEAIGKVVFRHWFVDFEFPNEEGKPYKASGGKMVYSEELDKEIPERWKPKPIDEIADFRNGLALQKFPARDGEEYLPVIKIKELRQGITESSDKANLDLPKEYIVNNGDLLFSWSGSLEVVIWCFGKGALNQHLFKVTSSKYPKWFFYYWILHYLPEYREIAAGKATTMGHIQRHHLTASQVVVPDDKTLENMNRVLSPIVERIISLKVETRFLSEVRDWLLPKLMSGKIRVSIDNKMERE